jgi:hypothetical protein
MNCKKVIIFHKNEKFPGCRKQFVLLYSTPYILNNGNYLHSYVEFNILREYTISNISIYKG